MNKLSETDSEMEIFRWFYIHLMCWQKLLAMSFSFVFHIVRKDELKNKKKLHGHKYSEVLLSFENDELKLYKMLSKFWLFGM